MKNSFRIAVLAFITSITVQAQEFEVFTRSIPTNSDTELVLDLENTYVAIETSNDNTIQFNYKVEFKNYSKRQVKKIVDDIITSIDTKDNKVIFKTNSNKAMLRLSYAFNTAISFNFDKIKSNDTIFKKSKLNFNKELNEATKLKMTNLLNKIKTLDANGKETKLNLKTVKIQKSDFTIKVPSHIKITIKAKNSQITFQGKMAQLMDIYSERSTINGGNFTNTKNNLRFTGGTVTINELNGGAYTFKDVNTIKLGKLQDVYASCEFSDLEIGEISNNVQIKDFNSKFLIHNFSENFKALKMLSEYSKISMFYPTTDFSLQTYGVNTVHYTSGLKTEIAPSKSGKKSKMMLIGNPDTSKHKIELDISHGIVKLGEDYILKK